MPTNTRIIQLTAALTYVGQATIEIPSWCRNDRFRAIIAQDGATARLVSESIVFGRVQGMGLAAALVSDPKTQAAPDLDLATIAACLRQDGFIF